MICQRRRRNHGGRRLLVAAGTIIQLLHAKDPESLYSVAGEPSVASSGWDPHGNHSCNIRRLSWNDLQQLFQGGLLPPLFPEPVVIHANHNAPFRNQTSRKQLLRQFPRNFSVVVTSSNAYSEHRRTVTLAQYLQESWQAKETRATQRANETWYLFGETFTAEWQHLLANYRLPPCQTCTANQVALSFGVGNIGSGVTW
jgi:hypothetical protein